MRSGTPEWSRRRGMVFIVAIILLASMMVVLVALANEVALELKMSANVTDAEQALEIAKVGIDNIRYIANQDPAWRTNYTSGVWISNKAVGDGTFTASGIDADGDLANFPNDPVTARATATYKGTTRTLSATLRPPVHESMMFLAYGVKGAQEIRIESSCRIYGDILGERVLLVSGTPDHRGGIYAESVDKVSAALRDADSPVVVYTTTPSLPPVDFAWFVSRGSLMTPPIVDGIYQVADKVISPTSNPHGFANAAGIYFLPTDRDVKFTRCYITGTIALASSNRKLYFDKSCVHAPAFSYYPAVVADGELVYSFDENLSEPDRNVDFNQNGNKTDVFTPSVSGVVYGRRKITGLQASGGTNIVRFKGALVSNVVVFLGTGCIFEQDPDLATNLVNQFHGSGLQLVPGSVKLE